MNLPSLYLVEDKTWPRFTLLGQSIGSIFLAMQGLRKGLIPDIWLGSPLAFLTIHGSDDALQDTMGYAFAYPFVRHLARVPIVSYTHYPTISTDMLQRVSRREAGHTNTSVVARSAVLSSLKMMSVYPFDHGTEREWLTLLARYYLIFAELYSWSLRRADVLMVNSTWTKNHIDYLLRPIFQRDEAHETLDSEAEPAAEQDPAGLRQRNASKSGQRESPTTATVGKTAQIVFPPCETDSLMSLPIEVRENLILSVAQFRPEKEHAVQLEAFKLCLDKCPQFRRGRHAMRLVLAGSVRNDQDQARVEQLRALARSLGIEARSFLA